MMECLLFKPCCGATRVFIQVDDRTFVGVKEGVLGVDDGGERLFYVGGRNPLVE